jgi:hypothetical protein
MTRYDDLDTKTIAISAVVSSIVLVVLILGGRALAYQWENRAEEEKVKGSKYEVSDAEIASQKKILMTSGKVQDPPAKEGQESKTRICIPIDKAWKAVSSELSRKSST